MLIFSFAKVVFWAQLGIFIYNMGSIGEFNLQMQSNSNLVIFLYSQGFEMNFAQSLKQQNEVVIYTKLPGGFYINTPAGHYNPDWAIVFKEGTDIKHVYFIAETKGYSDDEVLDYRNAESIKIECARRHFATISNSTVTYDVVKSYADLRNVITK